MLIEIKEQCPGTDVVAYTLSIKMTKHVFVTWQFKFEPDNYTAEIVLEEYCENLAWNNKEITGNTASYKTVIRTCGICVLFMYIHNVRYYKESTRQYYTNTVLQRIFIGLFVINT